jgi:hypothetical protein
MKAAALKTVSGVLESCGLRQPPYQIVPTYLESHALVESVGI